MPAFKHSTNAKCFRWRSTFAQQEQKLKLNLWKADYVFSLNTSSRGFNDSELPIEAKVFLLHRHCNQPFSLSRLVSATCL